MLVFRYVKMCSFLNFLTRCIFNWITIIGMWRHPEMSLPYVFHSRRRSGHINLDFQLRFQCSPKSHKLNCLPLCKSCWPAKKHNLGIVAYEERNSASNFKWMLRLTYIRRLGSQVPTLCINGFGMNLACAWAGSKK